MMIFDFKLLRKKLKGKRIAVVGDVCLDWYLFIDPDRSEKSVETGKFTKPVGVSRYSPGGAGNVAANLASLGAGNVSAYGVCGDDPFADALKATLTERGIEEHLVIQRDSWHTNVYTKVIEHTEEARRIDFGDYNIAAAGTISRVIAELDRDLPRCDLLIINQQLKHGIHSESFRNNLVELLGNYPDLRVVTDSRDFPSEYPSTIRKLNEREAAVCCGENPDHVSISDVPDLAHTLHKKWQRPVVITRGAYGCVVRDETDTYDIPGIDAGEGEDIVGAGDAFLAGFCCGLVCDEDLEKSAYFGNFAAVVTVAKQFETGTATLVEMEKAALEPVFRYHPVDAISRVSERCFYDKSEIEIITASPTAQFSCAIFDHDGTISSLRQGWELVMEPMMIDAIRGDRPVAPELAERIEERVRAYIDVTTGIQTISQMIGLVDLVREFGLVRNDAILTAEEYKAVYNAELIKMVETRTQKFKAGELGRDDVTIKGAVRWLQLLSEKGIRLYLASGTDEEDVAEEANLLGYVDLFDGGIYGATGSIEDEPKKRALERIMEDAGSIESVITFGDGPVEMRETVRRGGYAVGVGSDEIRRYGFNEKKRRRLVLSGADILIPDFSQAPTLYNMLFTIPSDNTGSEGGSA